MLIEYRAMQVAFEVTFKLVVPDWGPIWWKGTISLNLSGIPQRKHTLKIWYPSKFPNSPPEVFILKPTIVSDKYQYPTGQLSLFNPRDGVEYGWNPIRSTAAGVTAWGIQWLYAYYTWVAIGIWPAPSRS